MATKQILATNFDDDDFGELLSGTNLMLLTVTKVAQASTKITEAEKISYNYANLPFHAGYLKQTKQKTTTTKAGNKEPTGQKRGRK